MKAKVKRRLTSILCADVQSYARLMESDEAGTLETLRRYRSAMQALIDRHDGGIGDTRGDPLIVEFSEVISSGCQVENSRHLSSSISVALSSLACLKNKMPSSRSI
jgi:adenylate cyclase